MATANSRRSWTLRLFSLLLLAAGLHFLMAQSYPPNGPDIPVVRFTGSNRGNIEVAPAPRGWDEQSEWNMELVGYSDLQGRSAYQPLIIHQDRREVAYIGHHAGTALNPLTGEVDWLVIPLAAIVAICNS